MPGVLGESIDFGPTGGEYDSSFAEVTPPLEAPPRCGWEDPEPNSERMSLLICGVLDFREGGWCC